ncbi:MAG: type II secretion system F family protein [Clostridia bacterium]
MATYVYKAKNLKGEELAGTFDGVSTEALELMLKEKGYFIVKASKQSPQISLGNFFGKITVKQLAVFCRQFSVLINAGVTIVEAVGILREQMDNKQLQKVLGEMHEELQKGRVLSESMSGFPEAFPDFMMNMIKVGEASGSLDTILNRLADFYENDARIRRKVKEAMTYPIILAVMTVGVVILLLVKIIPMFSGILSELGGQLPLITKILVGLSNFLTSNFLILTLIIVGLVVGFNAWKRTESGTLEMDRLILRLPVISGLTKKVITARFARSLAVLLQSGIAIIESMDIISDLIGNKAIEEKFVACQEEIREGKGISEPLKNINIFPPLLIHMVAVGESTGELDDMLFRTAGFFDDEVEEAIVRMTTLIEPAMIVIMAAVVGIVILSVMLPMISVLNAVQ